VVGILIALQVNNWNEQQKLNREELKLLADLRVNLIQSKTEILITEEFNLDQLNKYEILIRYVEQDLPYNVELDSVFGTFPNWMSPYLTYTAYETLKSKGLDIISDDALKDEIVSLYESGFAYFVGDWDRWEWNINQDVVMPFFSRHIRADYERAFIARPNDFESLKKNEEFLNVLSVIIRTRRKGIDNGRELLFQLDALIENLEKELEVRNYRIE
jgi:hypothetical protein